MKRRTLYGAVVAVGALALTVNPVLARVPATDTNPPVSTDSLATMSGQTPTIVRDGRATFLHRHDPNDQLAINLGLPLRNQAALNDFIANHASHGEYMTNAQFDAEFGPTPDQVAVVTAWAKGHHLHSRYVSPDGVTITVGGSAADISSALNVALNDYKDPNGATFFSADRDATLPASLGVTSVSGLNNIVRFHPLARPALRTQIRRALFRSGGYYPSDFRTAYDLAGHGYDGTGQTIGFTLWGTSVANSDLATFASQTGDTAMSSGTGPDQIEWLSVNGGSTATDALVETALDVESAHGMATHAHLKYWLGDETCSGGQCGGSDVGLEDAISAAANDASLHVVSNSWGGGESPSTSDPFTSNTSTSFQHAVAVGTTFYFSSGDSGSNSGGTGLASYPADSPYVVSVGGTTLNTSATYAYSSESAWSGSGGGCSTVFARPSWQTGVGAATCSGRAEPDVSADADPNSGAYVYVQGTGQQIGGTSLAAPLFTGMSAVADRYAAQTGGTRIGWAAPKIYQLANSGSYHTDFHDVTSGNNGYPAGSGWDEATGWGSIDWWNYVQAIVTPSGPTPTPTNTAPPTSTPPPGSNAIANGGFESGSLSGWTATINQASGNAEVAPAISNVQHHSGSYSALVGGTSTTEPSGDSCLYQNFTTAGGTFSAYYAPFDPNGDTITYDWQEGYIRPSGTSGCSETGTQLFKVDSNSQAWTAVSASLAAGSDQAYFNVHEDGYSDPSYMYVDDVGAPAAGAATPTTVPSTATRTNTPVPPTATRTSTPSGSTPVPPTATRTNTPVPPTATNTPSGSFTNPVVNGGFETGSLSGWTSAGVGQGGQPVASTAHAHTGSYSAQLGVPSGSSEPNGDNCLYQNESFSGSHTLSFYDYEVDQYGDTISYDWQEAYWRSSGSSGCSETGTKLYKIESNSQSWYTDNFAVSGPGQIYFNVHEDGYGDPSAMYVDDVSIH